MAEKNKHIGLRCTEETLKKLKYIASYNGRSVNGEILYLINCEIKKFEKEIEKIELK